MRIAMFTDGFYPELGGIQDSIELMTRTLGKRGHFIEILAPSASKKDYELSHVPYEELYLGPNVHITRIPSLLIKGSNLQSRFVPPTFTRWKLLRRFAPEVIHTQTFFGLGLEALRASRKLGVPLVGTNHSAVSAFKVYAPFARDLIGDISTKAVVWYYNHCDFVTGPSHSVLDDLASYGLKTKHEPVSNPIDIVTFRPRSKEERLELKKKWSFTDKTMIYAGRFGIEKNIDVLIRALARLRRDFPEIVFALAGHGRDEIRLRKIVEDMQLRAHVRFLGTLPKTELAEAYAASELFVIASTSETQSMVLLQAFACGIPAVGADWLSLHEYIPDGVGYRATSLDDNDFARKISLFMRDPGLREKYGEEAVRFANTFSPNAVAEKWESVYGHLIQRFS